MFNSMKAKDKKSDSTVCWLSGPIEVVLHSQDGPMFKVTHEEAGIAWTVNMSQLAQLLFYSRDDNGKPLLDISQKFSLVVGEEPVIFQGKFSMEVILMQLFGQSVSVQRDGHPYSRCPLVPDFYFTIRHASEIPGVEDYKELLIALDEPAAA